jgi:hypothetical protein
VTHRPEDPAAVESLLAERDAIHGWLARLDEAGSTVPQAVRAKVRSDYERRMDGVTDRLRNHAESITNRLGDDRHEFTTLTVQATAARDALAEAELRHAVGEYDSATFHEAHSRHLADLEAYEVSLGAIAERIERLEEIQSLVSRAPDASGSRSSAAVGEPAEQAPFAAPTEVDPYHQPPEPQPSESLEQQRELAPSDGEADALLAIFDADPAPAPPAGFGPLSFTPSGGVESPVQRSVAPPIGMPRADPPRFVAPPRQSVPEPEAPPVSESSVQQIDGEPPPPPAPVVTEPPVGRSVRCVECGAMNRPNEWYCEKCGAELTAV